MAPMGIRLSPLCITLFCLLGVGVIYHLYAGVLSSRIASFRLKSTVDLRELLALSMEAAVQGGREVKRIREDNTLEEKSKGKTKEGDSEKLTLGDLNSHRKMFYLIKNTYPYIQVNSEEHANAEGEATVWTRIIPEEILAKISGGKEVPAERITVWIDPLDATQEYTENLQKYVTTMVCVAVDGDPVIGVIHKPFTGHTGYKVLALLDPTDEEQDTADIYIHVTYIKKWDICAGDAILRSLGGQMTTLKGEHIDYSGTEGNKGGLLASIKTDHKALVKRLPPWEENKEQ
ncbi:inositol monophosphatase 3 isoform X2 [Sinocyclocheilus rhinocerous]|uniref:inositol monophosphatase 3 isoform X2 n=1 Tax=Sinocyclocheilus rhinocerous TaxID=307959 RepID=UPI0007BA0F67|nr:PREDICTED: inositol monophosphatase 3 isoform X2 [Sinocyclocheilus rhinocerous]